ncbi:MAG TPA: hypothetical protein VFJ30_13790, partial [Phycisphaerae bacterium]|nr:hypothetical protein [Phycisphaerae bacterium]
MGFSIGGKKLVCPHCQGTEFRTGKALLDSRLPSYLGLDWLCEQARIYACESCGHIMWFAKKAQVAHVETSD